VPIEQLAEQSTFLESAYLLLYGDLVRFRGRGPSSLRVP
jgi:citrate synthase